MALGRIGGTIGGRRKDGGKAEGIIVKGFLNGVSWWSMFHRCFDADLVLSYGVATSYCRVDRAD